MILLPYPQINPVMIRIGSWPIHWYGLAYAVGIVMGLFYLRQLLKHRSYSLPFKGLEELLLPIILGIIIGGRLGYVLLYNPSHYLEHPLEILMTWRGGMSFHGGLAGVMIALFSYKTLHKLPFFTLTDVIAVGTPVAIFFGRMGNFINGEHYGRSTDVPWAMIFPYSDHLPRHPSQLYEAIGEGVVLGWIMYAAWCQDSWRLRPGRLSGLFLLGYGVIRSYAEFFREPDGVFVLGPLAVTMGQAFSLPMIIVGLYLIYWDNKSARGLSA